MRRRGVLTAAIAATFAGCVGERPPSGPRAPPTAETSSDSGSTTTAPPPGLRLVDRDFSEREDGMLLIEAIVTNTASEQRAGTLVVTAATPTEEVTKTRDLEVEPDTEVEIAIEFELPYAEFINGGSLSMDIET